MEKIWLKQYQTGVDHEIDINKFQSVLEVFEGSVQKFRDRPALACMDKVLSYGELDELSARFASFLQNQLQLQKGDRVGVMMPNLLQYPISVFGILRAGGTVVNINPLYTPRELEHQLNDSGAETIVILENFAATLEAVIAKTRVKNVIIASVGDLLDFPKSLITNFVVRKVKKLVPAWNLPGHLRFHKALQDGRHAPLKRVEIGHDDIAFLQYTGGTTGVAKGAMLLHKNIVANMLQAGQWVKPAVRQGQEVLITALPLYHIFALTANLMVFTEVGALNVLIPNPRDIGGLIKEIKKYKVSAMTGVNTLFNALIHHPEFKTVNFASWRLVLGGGTSVQKAVADQWKAITGVPVIEAYGLTEAAPAVSLNPLSLKEYNGSIGLPAPSTEIQLRNEAGQEVGIGESGELYVRGPQVMKGYWNRPDETAQVLGADGFLATGDMAVLGEDGYLRLVDRKKDMILVSGFNVYPNEIEDVVAMLPGVLEVACIGVPDDKAGEAAKIFVVKKDPSLTREVIIEHCRKNLTGYKIPKHVEFRSELPKTNVGKILRRALRDEAVAQAS